MRCGAHVDQTDPIGQAQALGVDVVQIQVGDAQSWRKPSVDYPGGASQLREDAERAGVDIYVHSAFVINVASMNNRIRIPSRKLLQQTLDEAAALGAKGVVVHGGHVTKDDDPAAGFENWRKAIDGLNIPVPLLIENTAGGNHAMMRYLEAMEQTWRAISASDNVEHVGLCLDTCHAFAAGLDMTTLVDDVLAITGRIDLIHLNDSQRAAGSGGDRHANLGHGLIPETELTGVIFACDAPMILETPPDGHPQDLEWIRQQTSN